MYSIFVDFQPTTSQLACGRGISAPPGTRCIYDKDTNSAVIGCRTLEHLRGCGKTK